MHVYVRQRCLLGEGDIWCGGQPGQPNKATLEYSAEQRPIGGVATQELSGTRHKVRLMRWRVVCRATRSSHPKEYKVRILPFWEARPGMVSNHRIVRDEDGPRGHGRLMRLPSPNRGQIPQIMRWLAGPRRCLGAYGWDGMIGDVEGERRWWKHAP